MQEEVVVMAAAAMVEREAVLGAAVDDAVDSVLCEHDCALAPTSTACASGGKGTIVQPVTACAYSQEEDGEYQQQWAVTQARRARVRVAVLRLAEPR